MNSDSTIPRVTSLTDVFREFPDTSRALGALHQEIMRRDSPFSLGERELMASLVSALNGCRYCTGIHAATAEAFGVDPGLLAELVEDIDGARIDPRLKPVMHFVAKLAMEPAKMVPADTQAILDAGWDGKAVFDAVCVCAFYSFMNRYVDGTGLESSPDELRKMGTELAQHHLGVSGSAT
ncbi:MAG: carboxymuconolactone decarboxylase family protein [Gammaproteobacteria bacterium]